MTIAFVANTSWNIYNFRKGLVQHFLREGHRVIVMAPIDRYTDLVIKWGVDFFETPLDGTGANPLKDWSYLRKLIFSLKTEKPSIILSYTIKSNIYSSIASRMLKIPVICNVSGLGTVFLVKGITGVIAMLLYKVAFRFSTKVCFQNLDDKELFTSKINLSADRIGLLPGSGINVQDFAYQPVTIGKPTRFLMIARLIVEKGVREYAEAARAFDEKDASFTLVGDLDENHARAIAKSELEEWVDGGFISYQPHSDDIKKLIVEHEVIVLPSYREGTPRTLLEAGAIGRPLIASDVPGCREVVRNKVNGFLFDLQSDKDFINAIQQYIDLKHEQKIKMGQLSRELIEDQFDEAIIINRYSTWIHQILTKKAVNK